jgi:hypothetical protein
MKKIFLILNLIGFWVLFAQGRVIYETDFESEYYDYWDFWSITPGWPPTYQRWHRGVATASTDSYSQYITNDAGLSNAYTTSVASVNHLYKTISLPPYLRTGLTILQFDFKGMGQTNYDYLAVYLVPVGTQFESGVILSETYLLGRYSGYSAWTQISLSFPTERMMNNRTLVFSWINNGDSIGTQPPAAIDNIKITAFEVPLKAINPVPSDGAKNIFTRQTLYWRISSSGTVPTKYKVFLGTSASNLEEMATVYERQWTPPEMQLETKYYWRIVPADDIAGDAVDCETWSFTTKRKKSSGSCTSDP